jgi:hypothetical protein
MNPRLILLLALCAAGRAAAADAKPAAAATTTTARTPAVAPAATPRDDSAIAPSAPFETFRLVGDRNIFDPNRTGRRNRSEEPAPRVDTISLVGTMNYEKGLFAFFDGSEAAYRKALRVGESVAQFKVTKIAANGVDLERDGKTIPMQLAQQLRRPDGADWTMVGADVALSEAAAAAAKTTAGKIDPSAPVVIPAGVDEVARRMMERRNKDLKQ